jgi:hypothetical protein
LCHLFRQNKPPTSCGLQPDSFGTGSKTRPVPLVL